MAGRTPNSNLRTPNSKRLVELLLDWFSVHARDLPWRRTRDPYAIWVSEIMLQQTQVKTVIPYWNRWMRELPTIQAVAKASPAKIHKLWEGLGYYTRVRNLQKAAQQIFAARRDELHESQTYNKIGDSCNSSLRNLPTRFPDNFNEVLALPGIGRYSAGAICSIAFNQPTPILDGNVIRVLTRVFGIGENPREKTTNARLWQLAEGLVVHASRITHHVSRPQSRTRTKDENEDEKTPACSFLNQSLMELGALICTPRNPQCGICPVKKLCIAFREDRIGQLPNLGKREAATARRFVAFVVEKNGRFLVRQRPAGVVNAHLWEFPNVEVAAGGTPDATRLAQATKNLGLKFHNAKPLCTVKHSITRYRITLEAWRVTFGGQNSTTPKISRARGTRPSELKGVWLTPAQMNRLAFASAHKKLASAAANCILSSR